MPWSGLIAGVNAITQLMAVGAYPIWSVTVLVIDGLIIYGLCVKRLRYTMTTSAPSSTRNARCDWWASSS